MELLPPSRADHRAQQHSKTIVRPRLTSPATPSSAYLKMIRYENMASFQDRVTSSLESESKYTDSEGNLNTEFTTDSSTRQLESRTSGVTAVSFVSRQQQSNTSSIMIFPRANISEHYQYQEFYKTTSRSNVKK